MPPKRRKLSLDEIVFDRKRQATENEVFTGITATPSDDCGDKSSEMVDSDKKPKLKTDFSTEASRIKDDTLKPTRISERLIIKKNRLGDAEEADSLNKRRFIIRKYHFGDAEEADSVNKRQLIIKRNRLGDAEEADDLNKRRLIIKKNRPGDAEEADSLIPIPVQNQTTPRKPKAVRQKFKIKHSAGKKSKSKPLTQWSVQDQKLFFVGIGEFGRNFEAISRKISHAAKQRGHPLKDKMQVRYFYYRCWYKISKLIDMNDKDLKMKTSELYGLINYGVLKNHVTENDPQFVRCLNELIFNGKTTYKARHVKNKRTRVGKIQTPVCTILKKINRIEDKQTPEAAAASQRMPHHITLELTPRNSKAWAKVQGISQNPRVRIKLSANRTLQSVFKYLDKKWKSHRVRLKESHGAKEELEEELVCFLHPSCKITPVQLIPLEQEKVDLTFNSFKENILAKLPIPKKTKVKEAETSSENKDKPKSDNGDEQEKMNEGVEVCSSLKPNESADLIVVEESVNKFEPDPPSSFTHLLTAATGIVPDCLDNPSGVDTIEDHCVQTVAPVAPKPSTVVLEDENAMFPDSSPFSPSRSLTELCKPSVIMPSSPSSESSSLPHMPASVISSPSVVKKKAAKSSKKTVAADEGVMPLDNCDINLAMPASDSSSSPIKTEPSTSAQVLKESLEKEVLRITALTTEGFTLKTSNTVTLLHLSLILGRKSLIRLEYEWRERKPVKVQLPLLCQAEKQMSNVLRRLCNLATLELIDLLSSEKTAEQNKSTSRNVPCSHCGRDGSTKSRNKRQTERKESTKEMATMTDAIQVEPPSFTQVFQPNTVLSTTSRTFVAGPVSQAALQIAGPDPVFRVPFAPTVKPVYSKEEQLRLEEEQRLQLQAKAIMQQGPSSHRLLKKRSLSSRAKKTPPIIVQRTLLPKVSTGQMVAYIQPGLQSMARSAMVVEMSDVKIAQPVANIVITPQAKTGNQDLTLENHFSRSDLLALAAQSAQISASSHENPEKTDEDAQLLDSSVNEDVKGIDLFSMANVVSTTSSSEAHPGITGPALNAHGDITISDLDISMSSVTGSNLGPDAGDKFLDMVLQNSEQGFSGLISTPKKLAQGTESYQRILADAAATFDPSVLSTPPHAGISNFIHSSSIFPSPIKLTLSGWPRISMDPGDLSLSSVLVEASPVKLEKPSSPTSLEPLNYAAFFGNGSSDANDTSSIIISKPSTPGNLLSLSSVLVESSPVKLEKPSSPTSLEPLNYAAFFGTSSSDANDTSSIVFSKPSIVTDISFGSLLGDSTPKKRDTGGVLPPVSASSETSSRLFSHTGGFFSDTINSEGPPLFSEVSQDYFARLEVDRAIQGMVSDSSMDLVSKFEFLAAQMTGQQDRDICLTGDRQERLLGGAGSVESALKVQGQSTAT
ncbi:hypothetical protein BsWGS_18243 [Bradybaena similaris]